MTVFGGPDIVTDGLVLHLDAANRKSYPGSGSIWYDLTNNNINSTLQNSPFYSTNANGTFSFDGVNDHVYHNWPSAFNYDNNTSPRSWEVFAKPDATMSYAGIFGHKVGAGCSFYCNGGIFIANNKWMFNWYDNAAYRWLDSGVVATSGFFAHIVATFGSDSIPRIYVNGQLKATYSSTTNMNYSSGMLVYEYGYNSNGGGKHYFNGDFGVIRFYNITLTADQVEQNYNALKGRFGL